MLRWVAFVIALSSVALLGAGAGLTSGSPAITGYPNSIAAAGDSITQAFNSSSFGASPENSWATGTNPSVNSVYSRLLALNPGISGHRFNDSVSGAKMVNLNSQVTNAVSQGAALVTILMGANDVCTNTEASMTSVATFRSQFAQAIATISAGLPDARVAVGSVPSILNLWSILKDNASAQGAWFAFGICQSMLQNPSSMDPADVTRRANVNQRNVDFNTQLAEVCAQYVHCRFDNNAAFNAPFMPVDVSTIDYFHPSVAGQTLAASVAWGSTYDFTDSEAPVTSAGVAPVMGGINVTLSATDNVGVAGIEYKVNGAAYQRYATPVMLPNGDLMTYRAVDVNGNIEASADLIQCASMWATPAGDWDCDGFTSARESFVGADPADRCADTTAPNDERGPAFSQPLSPWPVDIDDDRKAGLADVLAFIPHFGGMSPGPQYSARFDLSGDGLIGLADILMYIPFFNVTCTP
jgi:lysophospholipase L1-like esterase